MWNFVKTLLYEKKKNHIVFFGPIEKCTYITKYVGAYILCKIFVTHNAFFVTEQSLS